MMADTKIHQKYKIVYGFFFYIHSLLGFLTDCVIYCISSLVYALNDHRCIDLKNIPGTEQQQQNYVHFILFHLSDENMMCVYVFSMKKRESERDREMIIEKC